MAKVTSKRQVTVPKSVADAFAIQPGDELDWIPAGDSIRVVKRGTRKRRDGATAGARLRLFDESSERQRQRDLAASFPPPPNADRGWTREDLYRRGRSG